MFYAKLFKNTGYNLVNVPDSVGKLMEEYTGVDYPAMDILQLYHLDHIDIKVNNGEDDVIEADFLLLSKSTSFTGRIAAYSIEDYKMTSGDVCSLSVNMEPFLTAGGVNNIEFLDGTTTRHHIDVNQDIFGRYVEEDPLLVASRVPKIKFLGDYFCDKEQSSMRPNGAIVVDCINSISGDFSIKNAYDLAIDNDGTLITAITDNGYTGPKISNWETVPETIIGVADYEAGKTGNSYEPANLNGLGSFTSYLVRSDGESSNDGVSLSVFISWLKSLFEWNITNIIKNAYFIPKFWRNYNNIEMVSDHLSNPKHRGIIGTLEAIPLKTVLVDTILGAQPENFDDYNLRAYEGAQNQYILVATGTGEVISKNPEQLLGAERGMSVIGYTGPGVPIQPVAGYDGAHIVIYGWADLRAGGCPKFHLLSTDDSESGSGFVFKDNIKGQQWGSIPIGLNATAGAGQAAIQYSANKSMADMNAILQGNQGIYQDTNIQKGSFTPIGHITKGIGDFLSNIKRSDAYRTEQSKYLGDVTGFGSASMEQRADWMRGNTSGSARAGVYYQRELQAQNEALQYVVSQIPQPHLAFDANNNIDPAGNGVLLFKLVPDPADMTKYQKLLNQYGYRVTEPIKKSMMTNRPHYNYIQAVSVSCKANGIPKSVVDDLSAAFAQGLRIWHRKPDPGIYDSTCNKTGAAYNGYDPSQHGWVPPNN